MKETAEKTTTKATETLSDWIVPGMAEKGNDRRTISRVHLNDMNAAHEGAVNMLIPVFSEKL